MAEAVAVELPIGAALLAMAMVFFCWFRSPPAMLIPMLPLAPSAEPLMTAELWVDQFLTVLLLLNWRTLAVASELPKTKLLSIAELSDEVLAMAAALSCWLPLPAATLTPTLPLAPVPELLISASLTVPSLRIRLPVLR